MTFSKKATLIITALWALLYIVGNNVLVITDPVEGNYAETAREMLAAGNYMYPQIYGNYWFDKPIMFYWELIAAFATFGVSDFAARLFPALMSWVGLMLAFWAGKKLYDEKTGFFAALILATTVEFWYLGHAIITDMTLFVSVSFALVAFYIGYAEKKYRWYYAAALAAGVALLTKGPVGLALPGLIIFLFLLWQRDLRAILNIHVAGALALCAAVAGVWYVPMYLEHGSDFVNTFLGVHNYLRATVSEHPKDNVWWYYSVIFIAGFAPWSFVFIPAKIRAWIKSRPHLPTRPRERFMLVWAVVVFAVFQSVATKYVTYTFPYMIPVVLWMAGYFAAREKLLYRLAAGTAVFYVVALFAIAAPILKTRSTYDIAQIIKPKLEAGAALYIYKADESSSLAYYTGIYPKLLTHKEDVEERERQLKSLSWDVKDVMPAIAFEDIDDSKDAVVITEYDEAEKLKKLVPAKWELIKRIDEREIYFRKAPNAGSNLK